MIKPTLDVRSKSSWADVIARVRQVERLRLNVGVLSGTSEDGTPLATIAAAHEYGTSTVPARSFMASTLREHRREIAARLAEIPAAEIDSELAHRMMGELGEWIAERMREKILSHDVPPPLAIATIRRKQREGYPHPTKPLVRTGDMVAAIHWRLS